MADGIGCKCFASYQGECACDADWTPSEVYELRANINALREALEVYANRDELGSGLAKNALSSTPAQSLAEHDNEVIERCAKVCDEAGQPNKDEIHTDAQWAAKVMAANIRALKKSS